MKNRYMRWVVVVALVLLASFMLALAGSPFEPAPDFGCVPKMQATMVNDAGTPVPGIQTWTVIKDQQSVNSAGEHRLKCKYAFSAIIGDPQPTPLPGD